MGKRRRGPQLDDAIRRRLRVRRRLTVSLVAMAVAMAFVSIGQLAGFIGRDVSGDLARFDRADVRVERVVDGDTLDVLRPGDSEPTRVRLVGVDAPELHDQGTGQPAYWADESTRVARARCEGKAVLLRLPELGTRDKYGRLLAYVYLSNSESLNEFLVRTGNTYADRRFDHPFRAVYEQAENEARKKERGLWKLVRDDQQPAWRRQWLEERRKAREANERRER
jgi:micrococcal nuclease